MSKEKDIKIFVSAHKSVEIPNGGFFYPTEVGAANREQHFFELRDDGGENISAENPLYCELTAQYWAWKNTSADYYGFCHYRRFLKFEKGGALPYVFSDKKGKELLDELNVKAIADLTDEYDLIAPLAEKTFKDGYSQYAESKGQRESDLKAAVELLVARYPKFRSAADIYLNGDECYFGNMFVMKKELFDEYCSVLFDVLSEIKKRISDLPDRALGYIGERLCGIYITYIKNATPDRVLFVQRVDLEYYFDDAKKRKLLYKLLKPGTKARALVKKLFK